MRGGGTSSSGGYVNSLAGLTSPSRSDLTGDISCNVFQLHRLVVNRESLQYWSDFCN